MHINYLYIIRSLFKFIFTHSLVDHRRWRLATADDHSIVQVYLMYHKRSFTAIGSKHNYELKLAYTAHPNGPPMKKSKLTFFNLVFWTYFHFPTFTVFNVIMFLSPFLHLCRNHRKMGGHTECVIQYSSSSNNNNNSTIIYMAPWRGKSHYNGAYYVRCATAMWVHV